MASYIDRDEFIKSRQEIYCNGCERRQGVKKGNKVTLYEIGSVVCRSCGINDVLDDLEYFDSIQIVQCRECLWWQGAKSGERRYCPLVDTFTDSDFFCAGGEKNTKEDDE